MSAIDRFVEEMGLISQESGGPRIAGRIFGLLLAEGRAFSLHQISERLGVSRASVSTNGRMLARRGILKLTTQAGDRQDYYELANRPYGDMIGEVAEQFRRQAQIVQSCVEPMRAENAEAAGRVEKLSGFYRSSADIIDSFAEMLREQDMAQMQEDNT